MNCCISLYLNKYNVQLNEGKNYTGRPNKFVLGKMNRVQKVCNVRCCAEWTIMFRYVIPIMLHLRSVRLLLTEYNAYNDGTPKRPFFKLANDIKEVYTYIAFNLLHLMCKKHKDVLFII